MTICCLCGSQQLYHQVDMTMKTNEKIITDPIGKLNELGPAQKVSSRENAMLLKS